MTSMRRWVVLFAVIASLATGLSTSAAVAAGPSGSYIVQLRHHAPGIAKQYGGATTMTFDSVFDGFVFHGPDAAARRLAADPRVLSVERDGVAHAVDDPPPQANHLAVTDSNKARTSGYTGAGAIIAILDTGVDWRHPFFTAHSNVLGHGWGKCVGAPNAQDANGHGTATASNAAGRAGVAHEASILGVKVFPGAGDATNWSYVICGLNYVKKYNTIHPAPDNINVVNMSIAGPGSPALNKAVHSVIASGVVVVAAAGNTGGARQAPAVYAGVISASALNHTGTAYAAFSSKHATMAAPGISIFSADKALGTSIRSGTSRSAPQISGGVAVVLAVNPLADARQILIASGRCPGGSERGTSPCGPAWPGGGGSKEPLLDTYCAAIFADLATADPASCPQEP